MIQCLELSIKIVTFSNINLFHGASLSVPASKNRTTSIILIFSFYCSVVFQPLMFMKRVKNNALEGNKFFVFCCQAHLS